MRVVVAMMSHETNTFSPVPPPLSSFGPGGPAFGQGVIDAYGGTNTCLAAFLDIFKEAGGDILDGVISGRAVYDGRIDPAAAGALLKGRG